MQKTRLEQIQKGLVDEGCSALLCRIPQHVLLFTGYQPILGDSFCLVTVNSEGKLEIRLAVPGDEVNLVPEGIVVEVKAFAEETMQVISNAQEAVREPLREMLQAAGLGDGAVVGIEGARMPIVPAYTQVGAAGPGMRDVLNFLLPGAEVRDATPLLEELAAIKTEEELAAIRRCEAVAYQGFSAARAAIHAGASEADIAAATYTELLRVGYRAEGARNVQPYVHVMAGSRAALAYRAFNLTSNALLQPGDTVMVQMELGINGYWCELTRTFFVETVSDEWRRAHQACVAAQDAALKVIRDGVSAREVDDVARKVMQQAGFGEAFKHGLGHGFGFQAISHADSPVLHPASKEMLRNGMVHNMEPAVYLDGSGGLRLNDNVLVRVDGNEVVSAALPRDLDWLVVGK
jgi:Xaa-Pro dipeptidase